MDENALIEAIKIKIKNPSQLIRESAQPFPVVTAEEMRHFEMAVKRPIPQLLKRLYMEIGDGGWGPWAGFCRLGVRGDESEPEFSVLNLSKSSPEHLYFCDGGCTVFSVIHIPSGKVGLSDDQIIWQADSLYDWLQLWLSDIHVMDNSSMSEAGR